MHRYSDLVRAYVRDGQEVDLDAISALGGSLLAAEVPMEELAGLHEQALLDLGAREPAPAFPDIVRKTSACLTELMIAYSLADQKRKELLAHEQRMERERQRLEVLGQMAGGVAHEFNNLLQPILGMAEMALEDAPPGSELAEQLTAILDCAGQAGVIVHGILTTVRQRKILPAATVFAPLLERTVEFLRAIIPIGIRFDLTVSCGLERVNCDEGELSQILLNLLRNAADAMGGNGTVSMTLTAEDDADARSATPTHLRLAVADHGVGMAPEVLARASQPFYTTRSSGSGLGLSIVMAIVQGWQATMRIDSTPGRGTVISILLPIIAAPPGEAGA